MTNNLLVFQSDFGNFDGAVSAMHGVAKSVELAISIYEITHQIPQYNIWEASYRLFQAIQYWPANTVFVSIVDPGVGSNRRAVVAKTINNHYIVTPDNGTLTHLHHSHQLSEIRIIDESKNRLPQSGESHTFHGRDIFAFTGARLCARKISFEDIGPIIDTSSPVALPVKESILIGNTLEGSIDIIDLPFGNLWTNISRVQFQQLANEYGQSFQLTISANDQTIYEKKVAYGRSFADMEIGEPLLYVNSLDMIGIALNQNSFAEVNGIDSATKWDITIVNVSNL